MSKKNEGERERERDASHANTMDDGDDATDDDRARDDGSLGASRASNGLDFSWSRAETG